MDPLSEIIIKHEGLKLKPYTDTTGNLTIGIGRNLTTNGISEAEAYNLFDNDMAYFKSQLWNYPWYCALDEIRKGVLVELVFNIGIDGVLKFKNMIAAIKTLNYSQASKELLNSTWASQVGSNRANNMSYRLLTGSYPQ